MKNLVKKFYPLLMISVLCSCHSVTESSEDKREISLIPQPVKMTVNSGDFEIKKNTVIYYENPDLLSLSDYLADILNSSTGLELMTQEGKGKGINLLIQEDVEQSLGKEGYKLNVTSRNIDIIAGKPSGLFYGIQTLLQMIPVQKEECSSCEKDEIKIACVEVEDFPRFQWRGLLLDVARHFFTIDEIKRMVDEMAYYKFNVLQLHLTDDQGWRIEIKKLPELTATGAWRVPRSGSWRNRLCPEEGEVPAYGGFYTREELKDLIAYASARNVNILPEIEAPGHSLAAIASYPHLSSTGLRYKVNPGGCRFTPRVDNSICAGKETSYDYMAAVLSEVAEIFPFEYIHIGGDECFKGFWEKCPDCQKRMKENGLKDENELQSYFIKRLEKIVESNGKKLIGWDEILEGGLAPNATVMSWRGMQGGITAAKAEHHVVMSPVDYAYLDYYQGDPAIEPPTFAMLRLKKVYEFEPVPEGVDPEYILGGQGNLWTESVPTFRHAEYMLWPRSFALAEILWSPKQTRDWPGFAERTEYHLQRFSQTDINYSPSFYDAIITPSKGEKGELLIGLDSELEDTDIYYTFDCTYPDHHSPLYKSGEKLSIPKDADNIRVITYRDGKPLGRIITIELDVLSKRIPPKID